jgi:hypothetical protein
VKNASKAVRDAYRVALTGLSYNGANVPVYDDAPVQTVPDYYILIGNITEANEANDHLFIRPTEIVIDVVTRQYMYKDRDAVDSISESITEAVLTTIPGDLLNADFYIGHIQNSNSLYLDGRDGETYITRKILTFTQSLIQK